MSQETAHGSTQGRNGHANVSFSELARAHYDWDRKPEDERASRFHAALAAFESDAGEIVDAYWCRKDASAVALTLRKHQVRGRFRLRRRERYDYRLFRLSDWVTAGISEIPDLLHDCDILAIKASTGLEGVPRAVVMQWLMAVEAHVLGFVERHRDEKPSEKELKTFVARQRSELRRIEAYYQGAGEKRARLRYVEGMLGIGVLILVALSIATWGLLALFGFGDLHDDAAREFYAASAAGAVGAVISVMMRMSGRGTFAIDHEIGKLEVMLVGAYRPLIGAVSGVVVYFLVQTPMVPIDDATETVPFFVVIAFLAGFSERWTRMMLSGAMRTIADADEDEPPGTPAPPAAEAAGAPAKGG